MGRFLSKKKTASEEEGVGEVGRDNRRSLGTKPEVPKLSPMSFHPQPQLGAGEIFIFLRVVEGL